MVTPNTIPTRRVLETLFVSCLLEAITHRNLNMPCCCSGPAAACCSGLLLLRLLLERDAWVAARCLL